MLCAVIKGPSFKEAKQQIEQASAHCKLVELRLDYFDTLDLALIKELLSLYTIPMIFTLRKKNQGGRYKGSEKMRLSTLKQLAALDPSYLDIEHDVSQAFIRDISLKYPKIKTILSYHNFENTPKDLEKIYQDMSAIPSYFYKIAVTAQNSVDTLQLISFAKTLDKTIIAISMGLYGEVSRIIAPLIGSPINYISLEETLPTAPGQLTAEELIYRYNYPLLTTNTSLYGLIGNPISQSISDDTHNHFMKVSKLDAVYVKMIVTPEELPLFLKLAKHLFQGLSVTMPLKEIVLPYLDQIDEQAHLIGAVNTLCFKEGKSYGYNTDGIGALNALEKKAATQGSRLIILGAGGAAKAIAYEALCRGAFVTLVNRTLDRAQKIADAFGCQAKSLEELYTLTEEGYDVLINATALPMPIDSNEILPKSFVMDIQTKPKETPFLSHARTRNCQITYGYEMFIEQALGQFHIWFNKKTHHNEISALYQITSNIL
jgi:3-dehydroquinate dehydratase/shikimate dehydrogenase